MLSAAWMRPNHIMKGNRFYSKSTDKQGFPGSSASKESACKAGDPGSISGLGRSAGEGIGYSLWYSWVFPGGSAGKESACNVGDLGLIPGLGRSSGEESSYPLQYSGLENSLGSQRVGHYWATLDFPSTSDGKASACSEGDLDLIPGLGRCPGEGDGYPLQYSCLESFMDRGAWQATVHTVAKSQTWLSD